MSEPATSVACGAEHCVTCADEGVEMEVLRVDVARELALCRRADGEPVTVEIGLVEPVLPGDRVLVHAGTAIAALNGPRVRERAR